MGCRNARRRWFGPPGAARAVVVIVFLFQLRAGRPKPAFRASQALPVRRGRRPQCGGSWAVPSSPVPRATIARVSRGAARPYVGGSRKGAGHGMAIGFEIIIILLLIVLNGVFAMSELALVSVRRARLAVLERKGVPGAARRARAVRATRSGSCRPCRSASPWSASWPACSAARGSPTHLAAWLQRVPALATGGRHAVARARGRRDHLSDPGARRAGAEAAGAAPAGA